MDLHIHTVGVSPDVTDAQLTPVNICRRASEEGLAVIAIADHDRVGPLREAVDAGAAVGVVVLCGVELTTSGGHVVALFGPDEIRKVETLLVQLKLEDHGSGPLTTESLAKVLEAIDGLNGLGIVAHVERASGFEGLLHGSGLAKKLVWQSRHVHGFEIADAANIAWYTPRDPITERWQAILARREIVTTQRVPDVARIRSSDAHELARIGHAPDGTPRVTRIKMDVPSFPALRVAFRDPAARIKIEDELPERYPRIVGIACGGGFLDEFRLRLSTNLTCLIGGRGTGKSTVLETVRWLLGRETAGFEEQEGRAPLRATLYFDGGDGRLWRVDRERHQRPRVIGPTGELGVPLEIEAYSQGEIASLAKTPAERATELLAFVDQFIEGASAAKDDVKDLRAQLEMSDRQLAQTEVRARGYDDVKKQLSDIEVKLKTGKDDLERVVKMRQQLAAARRTRETLRTSLKSGSATVKRVSAEIAVSFEPSAVPSGVSEAITAFNKAMAGAISGATEAIERAAAALRRSVDQWEQADAAVEAEANKLETALKAKGLRADLDQLSLLLTQQDALQRRKTEIEAAQRELAEHRGQREELLARLRRARTLLAWLRDKYAKEVGRAVVDVLEGGRVTLGFEHGHLTAEYLAVISEVVHGTYRHETTLRKLTVNVAPENLYKFVQDQDVPALAAIPMGPGQTVGEELAREVISAFRGDAVAMYSLEHVGRDDLPVVVFVMEDAAKRFLHQLSQGQRQTILLALAFASRKECPLLIDQPEDELDNQFVFERVVTQLREAKERRQVLVVSHNANVVVLGDAELICVLKRGDTERATVDARGSIDNPEIRGRALRILEGGALAFERRRTMYDILDT